MIIHWTFFFIQLKVFWAIIFDAIIIHFTPQGTGNYSFADDL